jgi:hypothetical protein
LAIGDVKFQREKNEEGDGSYNSGTVAVNRRSLHHIQKELVLERFNGKNYNATTWIRLFEEECYRVEVDADQFPDVLRLVLEGAPAEWYLSMKKMVGNVGWSIWKKEFTAAFGTRGWSEISDALNFRYIGGSYSEYLFKKK